MQLLRTNNNTRQRRSGSAKAQIDIRGVSDELLILSNNKYCGVIETSSVNFELKSDDEQDALIETFQSFLNGLGFPIQILVRIREIDLDHYLDELEERTKQDPETIYRAQAIGYAKFVRSLVSVNRILSRNFYVVVPLRIEGRHDLEAAREQLLLKTEIVDRGLVRLGMNTKILGGLEILSLFYSLYNPRQAKTQPLERAALRVMHSAIIAKEDAS